MENSDLKFRAGGAGKFALALGGAGVGAVFMREVVTHATKNHISFLEVDHLALNGIGVGIIGLAAFFGIRGLTQAVLGRRAETMATN
jgi:hypothetical protein